MQSSDPTRSLLTREMRFWDPLGGRVEFSLSTFFKIIRHSRFLVFGALTLTLFFATDPSNTRAYVSVLSSAVIWPLAYVCYMTLYAGMMCVLSVVTGVFPKLRVPTSLIGLIVLYPTVFISEAVTLDLLSGGTYPLKIANSYLFYFLAVQVSEALFFRYIFPTLKAGVEEATDVDKHAHDQEARHVIIGGERIALHHIHHIEARQHHVHVTFSDSERRLRARMGDIVAQTTPADGVQTHRSWWVAKHIAHGLDEKDGRAVLRLKSDASVPIARTRVDDVKSWIDEHIEPDSKATAAE